MILRYSDCCGVASESLRAAAMNSITTIAPAKNRNNLDLCSCNEDKCVCSTVDTPICAFFRVVSCAEWKCGTNYLSRSSGWDTGQANARVSYRRTINISTTLPFPHSTFAHPASFPITMMPACACVHHN